MADFPTTPGLLPSRSLVDRARAIVTSPKTEWSVIDAEPATIGEIYRSYVLPLAAIGPVATLIGGLVFGYGVLGIHFRPSVGGAVAQAVVSYALTLVGVYVLALIIDALAPTFGGTKDSLKAFKVSAYAATAGWLAGIFGIFPPLAILSLVGLYSLYLLYLGLPRLMRAPEEKAMGYTVVVIVVGAVIFIVIGAIVHALAPSPVVLGGSSVSGTMTVPGVGSVDLGKLEDASKQANAAAAQMRAATTSPGQPAPALAPDVLQAMLPASLPGGFARTDLSSGSAGAAGLGGSNATATYTAGDAHIELSVTDMAAAGAFAALGSALNVQSSRQTPTGYEKVGTVDGRMTTEKWDNGDHNGTYSTIVANRFNVAAEGNPASIDALKAAVAAVDLGKLASAAGH